MNTIATQTYNTKEISTQVNNINFIIEDNQNTIINNIQSYNLDCAYNKIMKAYHKKINERGHCILKWRDYDKIHSKIAKETIEDLNIVGINPPFWLISRANKNNRT